MKFLIIFFTFLYFSLFSLLFYSNNKSKNLIRYNLYLTNIIQIKILLIY